ncbi:hypothetical protein ACSBQY_05865 [Micrococcus lylae]|uniref:hypothetical protein n=1 Tax=Micrococcus lylae TaxID=1273 RepID=UPI003EC0755D
MDFTDVLRLIFLALHFISVAAVLGGWFANFKRPTVTTSQWWGAIGMLVSGIVLAAIVSIVGDANHMKLGIKLLVGVIVFVAALIGRRKINSGESVGTGLAHAVGGMALINILVAVFI